MSKRRAATIVLVLSWVFLLSIESANAQLSIPQQIFVSANQLDFVGEQGVVNLNRTIGVVGVSNQSVNVTLFSTDLFDNGSGKVIPASMMTIVPASFSLPMGASQNVTVSLNISDAVAGTYRGVIIATSANMTTIVASSINVTAKIEFEHIYLFQIISIAFSVIFIVLAILLGEDYNLPSWKKYVVVILGFVAVVFWLVSVLTSTLTDPNNIVATVLIVPFLTFLFAYVKDNRDDRRDQEKTARDQRRTGIVKDVETLCGLIGEITSHYASFNSDIHEGGLISGKVWKESPKQGVVSDFPVLRLEKYYSSIEVYNEYYAYLLKVQKMKEETPEEKEINNNVRKAFDGFKDKYAELEQMIFVNLQYDIGLLSNLELSPLKIEHMRISQVLIEKLVESKVLEHPKNSIEKKRPLADNTAPEKTEPGLSSEDFKGICDKIYSKENEGKFMRFVKLKFDDRYKALQAAVVSLPRLPDVPELKQGKPLVKGTFRIDVDADKKSK